MKNICKIDTCEKYVDSFGYCSYHHYRFKKFGDPLKEIKRVGRKGKDNYFYGIHKLGKDAPFYGRKHTPEAKEKNRQWHLGKKYSEEYKAKMRLAVPSGKDSPHWTGGPKNYQALRQSSEHRYWSNEVKKRDNYICQICKRRGGKLHADHIKPFLLFPKLRLDIDNGRTLCVTCHRKTDSYGRRGTRHIKITVEVSNEYVV